MSNHSKNRMAGAQGHTRRQILKGSTAIGFLSLTVGLQPSTGPFLPPAPAARTPARQTAQAYISPTHAFTIRLPLA